MIILKFTKRQIMQKKFLIISFFSGALSVMLGAFAAHGLKGQLSPENLQVFETGVRYQFYHNFALIAVALMADKFQSKLLSYAGHLFVWGILLFSGSLYFLAVKSLLTIESLKWIGFITPFGGVCFITGWLLMFVAVFQSKK